MEKITLSNIILNRLNFRILTFKCLMPVLFVFGVIFFLLNIIPIKVNFETHNNIVIAHVSKRELFPPLKKINKDLYDVKQAIFIVSHKFFYNIYFNIEFQFSIYIN